MKFTTILQNLERKLYFHKMKYKIEILFFVVIGVYTIWLKDKKVKEDFDHDNSDFIKDYFINHKFLD